MCVCVPISAGSIRWFQEFLYVLLSLEDEIVHLMNIALQQTSHEWIRPFSFVDEWTHDNHIQLLLNGIFSNNDNDCLNSRISAVLAQSLIVIIINNTHNERTFGCGQDIEGRRIAQRRLTDRFRSLPLFECKIFWWNGLKKNQLSNHHR